MLTTFRYVKQTKSTTEIYLMALILSLPLIEKVINIVLFTIETFLIFQGREMNSEMAELFMENLPNLKKFGDFNSFDLRRPNDIKRFHSKIREEKWDIQLFDSQNPSTSFGEKDFNKLLTLHWFYLTDGPTNKRQ